MAAVTEVQTITITINDIEVQVPKGELIVESVKRIGLEIPIFCYHPRMKPVGMCRMCLVEIGFKQPDGSVRKMPKPQAGCTLPASEGMVVYTDTEMVQRDRKGVLEFLLINHPLDCPICDRGGECPLQNNTLFYGPSTSRFVESKRHLPKAFPLSQYVTLDLERCIQCGRCVRFTEEISGDSQLAFRFRGAKMQPTTFELTNFSSKFSGNVIEICPVGALTSARYRFRARPWDLETRPSICTGCSNGCNIWFDYRVHKMVRINGRTNEAVNEEWTCDKGKFGFEHYNTDDRLTDPLIRKGDRLVPCSWADAYAEIIAAFKAGGNKVAALAGDQLGNEDLFMLQKMFRKNFQSNNLDYRFFKHLPKRAEMPGANETIASFERRDSILVFGTALEVEEPILYLRVRKAWFHNAAKVIVAHHEATDGDSFAHLVLRYKPGTAATLAHAIAGEIALDIAEAETGVPAAKIREAAEILKGAPVIATQNLYNLDNGPEVVDAVAALAKSLGGTFNLYALGANHQGAHELGVLPDSLPNGRGLDNDGNDDYRGPHGSGLDTHGILAGCANGSVEALWLADVNPFDHLERSVVEAALENVGFLVVQASAKNEALDYASVVLPTALPAERDGTMTNMERRVQRLKAVLQPKGEAKAGWKIYSEVGLRVLPETPLFSAAEVMAQIAKVHPGFAATQFDSIAQEGTLLA